MERKVAAEADLTELEVKKSKFKLKFYKQEIVENLRANKNRNTGNSICQLVEIISLHPTESSITNDIKKATEAKLIELINSLEV